MPLRPLQARPSASPDRHSRTPHGSRRGYDRDEAVQREQFLHLRRHHQALSSARDLVDKAARDAPVPTLVMNGRSLPI
jgi:hypothetical protein